MMRAIRGEQQAHMRPSIHQTRVAGRRKLQQPSQRPAERPVGLTGQGTARAEGEGRNAGLRNVGRMKREGKRPAPGMQAGLRMAR